MRLAKAGKVALGVLAAAGLLALLGPVVSHAQSQSRLRQNLAAEREQQEAAQKSVRTARAQASRAKNRLVEAQESLAAAEARLKRAQRRLRETREELVVTRKRLDKTQKRLSLHESAMKARVLAMFRNQDPSYAEVLLRSTSFEDFANRAEFTKRLAQCDETVLIGIVDAKMEVEDQQALLKRQETRQIELRKRVEKEKAEVVQREKVATALWNESMSNLAEAERQLDEQEAEVAAVEAMLRRMEAERQAARSSGGRGSDRSSHSSRGYEGSWNGSLLKPVGGSITSPYGMRRHPITGTMRFHDGVDIGASGGTTIRCAAAGRVVSTGWRGPYGLTVVVDHGSGLSTMYAHCQRGSICVSAGQEVGRGTPLAAVDSTGWSTGNHLHFTVFRNGRHVNPMSVM